MDAVCFFAAAPRADGAAQQIRQEVKGKRCCVPTLSTGEPTGRTGSHLWLTIWQVAGRAASALRKAIEGPIPP
jgi:hypothetical protein